MQGVTFNNNSGLVLVGTGTLRLATTGSSSGEFQLLPDTMLDLAGNYTFNAGASVSGAGRLRIDNATLTVAADVEADRTTLASGAITGPGTYTCTDDLQWTGGSMSGSGATTVTSGDMAGISARR